MVRMLLCSLLLVFGQHSIANEFWPYTATKNGITLVATGGFEDTIGYKMVYDDFLDLIIKKTKHSRGNTKMLIVLDEPYFPYKNYNWLAHISYDTLRTTDWAFIESYYSYLYDPEVLKRSNGESGVAQRSALDINATSRSGMNEVGLKIIYNYTEIDSVTAFDRILALAIYACEHIDKIKETQKRTTLKFNGYKDHWVTALTIDSALIASIPLSTSGLSFKDYIDVNRKAKTKARLKLTFYIIGSIFLFGCCYLLYRAIRPSNTVDNRLLATLDSIQLLKGVKH